MLLLLPFPVGKVATGSIYSFAILLQGRRLVVKISVLELLLGEYNGLSAVPLKFFLTVFRSCWGAIMNLIFLL